MKKASARVGVAAVAVLLIAGAAFAGGEQGKYCDPEAWRNVAATKVNQTLDELAATPEQRQQILAITNPLIDQAIQLHQTRRQAHEQFLQEWRSPQPNAALIRSLAEQQADAVRAFGNQATDAFLQIHAILTPEQRQQLSNKFAQAMQCPAAGAGSGQCQGPGPCPGQGQQQY